MTKDKDEDKSVVVNDAVPDDDATLLERILWVRDRVTRLGKDSTVSAGQGSYKAISHDKVTAFIRPKLVQAGIFVSLTCVAASDVETGAVTAKGRKIVQHRACYEVTFCCATDPKDNLVISQWAYADDYGDKAPGKATSYAFKYALLKMFMIETGEEDAERVEGETDGGRAAVIGDDENLLMEIYAVAEECFGDDAKKMLKAMAQRRFFVEAYSEIPQDRFADAVRSLRVKAASMDKDDDNSEKE